MERIARLIEMKLKTASMLSEMERYSDAEKALEDAIEFLNDALRQTRIKSEIKKLANENPSDFKKEINALIKDSQHHLGELEDWIHINRIDYAAATVYKLVESVENLDQKVRSRRWLP